MSMNIFRLLGDLSHVLAIIILLHKIWHARSAAGALPPCPSAPLPPLPIPQPVALVPLRLLVPLGATALDWEELGSGLGLCLNRRTDAPTDSSPETHPLPLAAGPCAARRVHLVCLVLGPEHG